MTTSNGNIRQLTPTMVHEMLNQTPDLASLFRGLDWSQIIQQAGRPPMPTVIDITPPPDPALFHEEGAMEETPPPELYAAAEGLDTGSGISDDEIRLQNFGRMLTLLMKRDGITTSDLAEEMGRGPSCVRMWMRGSHFPTKQISRKLYAKWPELKRSLPRAKIRNPGRRKARTQQLATATQRQAIIIQNKKWTEEQQEAINAFCLGCQDILAKMQKVVELIGR